MSDIDYTWDETKRQKTLSERGLDFADMAFFDWDTALTLEDIRQDYPETRYSSKGLIKNMLVNCVWCYRDGTVRIISMRKANKRERMYYEKQTQTSY